MVTSKNPDGQIYNDHLYCDSEGNAVFKLDTWEIDVLDAERQKEGFICWLRNIPNKESSLCIQYKLGTELKPLFPDFIVVRKVNEKLEFYILEPHFTGYADSVPKLKGMAAYSERCTSVKRNEMLRVVNTSSGKTIQSLNVAFSAVRNDVYLMNDHDHDELNNLFVRFSDHI
jgi:type III restriction enzyme